MCVPSFMTRMRLIFVPPWEKIRLAYVGEDKASRYHGGLIMFLRETPREHHSNIVPRGLRVGHQLRFPHYQQKQPMQFFLNQVK